MPASDKKAGQPRKYFELINSFSLLQIILKERLDFIKRNVLICLKTCCLKPASF